MIPAKVQERLDAEAKEAAAPKGPSTQAKSLSQLTATEKKALILEALGTAGYTPYQASKLMDVSKQLAYRITGQMQTGALAPLLHKAKKAIKLLLDGQPVGEMEEVKGSDVLGAAKMVMERADPVVTRVESRSMRYSIDLTPEKRDRYKRILGLVDPDMKLLESPEEK